MKKKPRLGLQSVPGHRPVPECSPAGGPGAELADGVWEDKTNLRRQMIPSLIDIPAKTESPSILCSSLV